MASAAETVLEERGLSWRARLPQLRDPGRASLRRAIRAALLVPALFAVCSALLPEPQLITFVTFGVFALSVLGDFGGPSRRRAAAYALTAAVGCAVISLVLAVAIPVSPEVLPRRLAGWMLGSTAALVGGVWLWPRHEQTTLQAAAAAACEALAELVNARYVLNAVSIEAEGQRARAAVQALRQAYMATPWRPATGFNCLAF